MRLTNSVAAIVSFFSVGIVEGASDVTFAADRTLTVGFLNSQRGRGGTLEVKESPRVSKPA